MKRGCWLLIALLGCSSSAAESEYSFSQQEAFPQPSLLPPADGPRLVVTNSGDDTVSLVDPESFEEIARVHVGAFPVELESPHHVAPAEDGSSFLIGISNTVERAAQGSGPHGNHGNGSADGYVLRIDATTGRETARVRVDRSPGDVRIQPGTHNLWVSHYDLLSIAEAQEAGRPLDDALSTVIVYDIRTMERLARVPACLAGHGIDFSPDGSRAYIACAWNSEVAVVDTSNYEVLRVPVADDANLHPYEPYALTVAPDGAIWVSNIRAAPTDERTGVSILDADTLLPERFIPTEGLPLFGDFDAAGDSYYVVTQRPDRLLVLEGADGEIREEVDLSALDCLNAHAVRLSPDESRLFLVCEGDRVDSPGSLHRLDRATLQQTARVELGIFPDDVAWLEAVK